MLEMPEIQWQKCRKCGDWRSHYPVASYEIGKPPNWHCSLCGTAYIRDYIDRETWQSAEIQQAIREADAGDFASDDEVNAISAKWKHNAG